jgi:purine-binding chemotaxis protein CheW
MTTHDVEAAGSREYLTFRLGEEEYGIDILKVQEIRRYDRPTHITGTPPFMRGVIDLRGLIVPIVDLRMKFALPESHYDEFTVTIILNIGGHVVGVVVDLVSDVITLAPDDVKAMPDLGSAIDRRFHTGIGRLGERMIILVDIEQLMTSEDMQMLSTVAA